MRLRSCGRAYLYDVVSARPDVVVNNFVTFPHFPFAIDQELKLVLSNWHVHLCQPRRSVSAVFHVVQRQPPSPVSNYSNFLWAGALSIKFEGRFHEVGAIQPRQQSAPAASVRFTNPVRRMGMVGSHTFLLTNHTSRIRSEAFHPSSASPDSACCAAALFVPTGTLDCLSFRHGRSSPVTKRGMQQKNASRSLEDSVL